MPWMTAQAESGDYQWWAPDPLPVAAPTKTVQQLATVPQLAQAAPVAAPSWPAAAVRWSDLPDLGGVAGFKASDANVLRAVALAGYTGPALRIIGRIEAGAANEAGAPAYEAVNGPTPAALDALDRLRWLRYSSGGDFYADAYNEAGRMLGTVKLQDVGASWADKLVTAATAIGAALVTGGALGLIGTTAAPAAAAAAPAATPAGAAVGFTGAVQAEAAATIQAAAAAWDLAPAVMASAQAPSVAAALAAATPAAALGFTGEAAARVVAPRVTEAITVNTAATIDAAASGWNLAPAVMASAQAPSVVAALAAATPAASGLGGILRGAGTAAAQVATTAAKSAIVGVLAGQAGPKPATPATTAAARPAPVASTNPALLAILAAAAYLLR